MGWGEPGLGFLLLQILGKLAGEAVSTPRNAGHFGSLSQDVGRDLVAQGSHATCNDRTWRPEGSGTFTLWLCQNSYWKWSFIVSFPIKKGDVQ